VFSNDVRDSKEYVSALKAIVATGVIGAFLIVVGVSLTRIQPPSQAVNFDTVFHGDIPLVISKEARRGSSFYNQLFLLTSITDVQTLSINYSSHSNDPMLSALSKVDYSQYGVLVAYMGASLNTGSAITVEKVIRNGNTINVRVTQNKPESGDQAVVNYFHAIAVKLTELPDPRKITVSLWINDSWNAVQGRGYIPH
jgi:hypothetical protein